jgi:putative methionine-R-sulfoxide reductase with GAF domain
VGSPQGGTAKAARIGAWLVDARIPDWSLMALSIAATGAATAAGIAIGLQGEHPHGGAVGAAVVFAVLAPTFAWFRELKKEAQHAAQQAYEEDRLVLFRTAVLGAFTPLATLLSQIAAARPEERASLEGRVCQAAVDVIPRVLGSRDHNRNRATFYRLSDDGSLDYQSHAGRSWSHPRPKFEHGTRAGNKVLAMVRELGAVRIPDIDADPALRPTTEGSYQCVISCSVFAGKHPLGMLSVDAPEADELTTDDEMLMKVLARLLGVALYKTAGEAITSGAPTTTVDADAATESPEEA